MMRNSKGKSLWLLLFNVYTEENGNSNLEQPFDGQIESLHRIPVNIN